MPYTGTTQAAIPDTSNWLVYNPGDNIKTGTWTAAANWKLLVKPPLSTNTDPNAATMLVYEPSGTQIGQFDYSGWDTGVQFAAINTATNTTYYHNAAGGAFLALVNNSLTLAS